MVHVRGGADGSSPFDRAERMLPDVRVGLMVSGFCNTVTGSLPHKKLFEHLFLSPVAKQQSGGNRYQEADRYRNDTGIL